MARWKRLFYYLMINVLVSACTTLAVLTIWERTHPQPTGSLGAVTQSQLSPTPPVLATSEAGSAEPTTMPTQAFTTYVVQAGDMLSEIALEFQVPVSEIMQLNGLENADAIAVGMELTIPVVETTPEASPPVTPAPEGTAEAGLEGPTPTSGPSAGEPLVVVTNIFGAGDLATERVRLERRGDGDLNLAGWQLVDEEGSAYTFPQLTLFRGGAVDLYTRAGTNDVVELYWGLEEPVWESGEIATLLDEQGNVRATFTVP